jgi:hypothetical protein
LFVLNSKIRQRQPESTAAQNTDSSKRLKKRTKKIEMYEETEGTSRYDLIQEM